MGELRKITVNLPSTLVDEVTSFSGKGLTETIREMMQEYRDRMAWERLASFRGKVDLGDWRALRGKDEEEKDLGRWRES